MNKKIYFINFLIILFITIQFPHISAQQITVPGGSDNQGQGQSQGQGTELPNPYTNTQTEPTAVPGGSPEQVGGPAQAPAQVAVPVVPGQAQGQGGAPGEVVVPAQGVAATTAKEPGTPSSVLMSVVKGNPAKGVGKLQQYRMNDGESIFVEVAQPPTQIEQAKKKQDIDYQAKVGQVSSQISQKVSAIQTKEAEYANEIYPASKAPIELERQDLEKELRMLQQQKEQIESERTAQQSQQKIEDTNNPSPSPVLKAGLKVGISLSKDKITFIVTPSNMKGNAEKTSLEAAYGEWTRVLDAKNDEDQVWVKAENTPE